MKRKIPIDLSITLLWTVMTFIFVITPIFDNSIIRTILGIPMVLFIPGYVLIAALFSKNGELDVIERIALSLGLSITIVPLLGLILNFTFGIRLIPLLITLCSYSIILIFIANYRRNQLPEDLRFKVTFYKIWNIINAGTNNQNRTDKILTTVLILSMIMAVGMLIYVIFTPKTGERYTEFYILGLDGKADNYPTNLQYGIPSSIIVGIVNHEYSTVNYTVEMALDEETLLSKDVILNNNQTWEKNFTITINKRTTDAKFNFWLFKENNFTNPYRELHLWMNVT